jgi:cyclopropane-fatty-acyl-phospholipid synthase
VLPRTPITKPLSNLARRVVLSNLASSWRQGQLALQTPDGTTVTLGDAGSPERADVRVNDDAMFWHMLTRGEMGAGEAYMDGAWDADDLVAVIRLFVRNLDHLELETPLTWLARVPDRIRHVLRANNRSGSRRNIRAHYDLGNDFYSLFLGATWVYSCALFSRGDETLEQAQHAKLDRLYDLLELDESDHLLDVGCGWGELAIRAALTRGCRVTGITVSPAQLELARERAARAGVAERVDFQFCDYRDVAGRFDKIASVEMIEAVGYEYLGDFFRACAARLAPGGRMALQAITMPETRFARYRGETDWMQTYIFPGSLIPSLASLFESISASGMRVDNLLDIGEHYAPTLRTWRERFTERGDAVEALGFDDRFRRMWTMYLAWSEAAFAEHSLGDAQILIAR